MNPLNKTPRRVCSSNKAYDVLDLETLPDNYLARVNYITMDDRDEYMRRTPRVSWVEDGETVPWCTTNYFRLAFRAMIGSASERTLIGALIPPDVAHHCCPVNHRIDSIGYNL